VDALAGFESELAGDAQRCHIKMKSSMSLSISAAHIKKSGLDGADIGPEV